MKAAVLLAVAVHACHVSATPRVVVVGGTHGNEFTGVYVIEHLKDEALRRDFPHINVETLLANPRAHAASIRFVDDDLNRQFLHGGRVDGGYEAARAEEIEAAIGPKGSPTAADMVIDLHTTTANMGTTVIVNSYCQLALRAAAYLTQEWGTCEADGDAKTASTHPLRVYLHDVTHEAAPYLCSVGKAGITVEVGPTPQGLLRADAVGATERALRLLLRFLELDATGQAPPPPATLPVYVDGGKVPWPAGSGTLSSRLPGALVAPSLQDRDFQPLKKGEPMFVTPDGGVIHYDGAKGDVVYPIFVNEAAYYLAQSGSAGVALTTRVEWPVERD